MSQIASVGIGSSGASPIQTVVTDSGSVTPAFGLVNVVGSTNIVTQEVSNSVVISLKNNILANEFIAGDIDIVNNSITSEDTFDITFDPNGLGKVSIAYASPNSQLSVDTSKNFIASSSMNDGQLLIGSTSGSPAPATLTAGPGISITNNPGQITISNTGSGGGFLSWQKLSYGGPNSAYPTFRYQAQPNTGYIANSWYMYLESTVYRTLHKQPIVLDLPPNDQLSIGDTIAVLSLGGGDCYVNANVDQLVTWCNYKYGGSAYPAVYTATTYGNYVPAPAFGYGYCITPSDYPGPTGGGTAMGHPQALWFVVIGFDGPNNGAVFYLYKVQQYAKVLKSPYIP